MISIHIVDYRNTSLKLKQNSWLSDYPIASTGPLKGVLIGLWWVEIQKLQMNNQFLKIDSLTERISILNPYIPDVWEYLSWNMSFNISIEMRYQSDKESQWIFKGFDHLKKGLVYNPRSHLLHYSQAWMVYSKLKSQPKHKKTFETYLEMPFMDFIHQKVEIAAHYGKLNFLQSCFRAQINAEAGYQNKSVEIFEELILRYPNKVHFIKNMIQEVKSNES